MYHRYDYNLTRIFSNYVQDMLIQTCHGGINHFFMAKQAFVAYTYKQILTKFIYKDMLCTFIGFFTFVLKWFFLRTKIQSSSFFRKISSIKIIFFTYSLQILSKILIIDKNKNSTSISINKITTLFKRKEIFTLFSSIFVSFVIFGNQTTWIFRS